jgi:biofilm PGA synthesis N-glycosyltransferase PgaC
MSSGSTYVLVSAVKDEEKYIERTIQAVLQQTIRPYKWVVVDDGSQDRTRAIVEEYANRFPWIIQLTLARDASRQPGAGVIRAFNKGFELVKDSSFDFIAKLDCDIDFPADYFEQLIARFQREENLGIASGIYLEERRNRWVPVKMPAYHAAGASKMIRIRCFSDIGGFVASRGWDTLDEIRAQMMGWRTRHFREIKFRHLKKEGSASGCTRTSVMQGEIYYLTGGGGFFFSLKLLHRLFFCRPILWGGFALLFGFLRAKLSKQKKLVNDSEAKFYRRLLNRRIVDKIIGLPDRLRPRKSWQYT